MDAEIYGRFNGLCQVQSPFFVTLRVNEKHGKNKLLIKWKVRGELP